MVESTVAVNCTKKEIVENVVETKAINVVKSLCNFEIDSVLMRRDCFLKTIINVFQRSSVVKACVILKLTLLMRNSCFLKTILNMFQSS